MKAILARMWSWWVNSHIWHLENGVILWVDTFYCVVLFNPEAEDVVNAS